MPSSGASARRAVSQGSHPPGAGTSVLGHLLGDDETVPPDRGLFLEET